MRRTSSWLAFAVALTIPLAAGCGETTVPSRKADAKTTNTGGPKMSEQKTAPDATTTEGFRMIALMSNSFQLQASTSGSATTRP